jgi:thiamine biosynthesis lipoprotein
MMARHDFRAMGTDVEVHLEPVDGQPAAAFAEVEQLFEHFELLFSRFRPDSALSQLNAHGSAEVDDHVVAVVRIALNARERTGGRVDPTVHDAVVAAGYDRSFEDLPADGPLRHAPRRAGGGVRVAGRTVELDPGVRLDLGGFAKGYAVDRAVELLSTYGPCLVNAGGDLAVGGGRLGTVWPVSVPTPDAPLTIGVRHGGLATSGRDRRRWWRDGVEQHHLIDPETGRPAASDLLRVSVAAPSAVEAEVLAKWLFIAGEREAVSRADAMAIPSVLVTADGRVRLVGGLR